MRIFNRFVPAGSTGFWEWQRDPGRFWFVMVSGSVVIAALVLQELSDGRSLSEQRFEWQASWSNRTDGDYASYAVTLDSGKKYIFEARRARGGNSADPYLILCHPAGFPAASDDDGAGGLDARLVYAPQSSGT
jgi:hypothetical protein